MQFKKKWLGALLILLFSWCTYKGYESSFFYSIPFYIKHIINFSILASIFAVGYYVFKKESEAWVLSIWVNAYLAVILVMVCIGILDLFYRFYIISSFRELVYSIRMFFSSPVPYGILLFLERKIKRAKG